MNALNYLNQLKEVDVDCLPMSDQKNISVNRIVAKRKLSFLPKENIPSYFIAVISILLSKYSGSNKVFFMWGSLNHAVKQPFTIFIDTEKTCDFFEAVRETVAAFDFDEVFAQNVKELDCKSPIELCINTPTDEDKILSFEINKDELLVHAKSVYSQTMTEGMADSFVNIAAELMSRDKLSEIRLVDEQMMAHLDDFNKNSIKYDTNKSMADLFNLAFIKYADREAVIFKDSTLSYKDLDGLTKNLAGELLENGVEKNDIVGVLINRSEYMAVCSIGVLRAGAAYLPLDPGYPTERLEFMLKDAAVTILIADEALYQRLPRYKGKVIYTSAVKKLKHPAAPLPQVAPEDLFIVLYTSGSTGQPKGCLMEHGNLTAFCHWYQTYYELKSASKVAGYASYGFDASMMDLYPALTAGASVHIIPEEIRLDLIKIAEYFKVNQITHSFMTTQVGRQFAMRVKDTKLQHLSIGGETLVTMKGQFDFNFYNGYGPTECTIFSTIFKIDGEYDNVPIGKMVANLKGYIVDTHFNRVPIGAKGELLIAGPQVARGYHNRPELSAFMENPFDNDPMFKRMYKTGDIVRYLPDGNIQFMGRKDGQVKIRGFRIELAEVEGILRAYHSIQDVTVAAFEEADGGKYIAAYVVSEEKVDRAALKDFILKNKPSYMVPAVIMQIDKIPLNQNQKVNKKALPIPQREVKEFVLPQNERQRKIYQIIADIAGHEKFGIETDLKDVISSIGMIKLNVLISEAFDRVMTIKDLNEFSTVWKLEKHIAKGSNKIKSHEKREKYGLSETQKGIFVECISGIGSTVYNIPFLFKLKSEIEVLQIADALKQVMKNYSYLKTTLEMSDEGDILQLRNDEAETKISIEEQTDEAFLEIRKQIVKPFEMLGSSLYHFTIYKTTTANYLYMDFHHIIMDGYSLDIVWTELAQCLKGESLKPETYSGFDVVLDEEESRKTDKLSKAKEYYKELIGICPNDTRIVCDKEEGQEQVATLKLPMMMTTAHTKNKLKVMNVTENAFFISAFALLLAKYNHTEASRFTTIYNGRSDSRTENTTAMLVKTLPAALKVNCTVKELLISAKEQLMNSITQDIYSFSEISREFGFIPHTMFIYQGESDGFEERNDDFGTGETLHIDKAKAQLSLNVYIKNGAYYLNCEYCRDLYEEHTVKHMAENLSFVAQSMLQAEKVSEISLPFEVQKEYIPLVNKSFMQMFEENVRKHPNKTAIIDKGGEITYETLDKLANGLAKLLLQKEVSKSCVGVCCGRTRTFMISVIGILKAGCSYLPIDPEYPKDRVAYMLENSQASALLFESAYGNVVDTFAKEKIIVDNYEQFSSVERPPAPKFEFDSLAYTIYTSGSTGKPKGVMLSHLAFTNLLHNTQKVFEMKEEDVFSAFSSFCFDATVIELFPILAFGGTLYIIPEGVKKDVLAVCREIVKQKVTISCFPTQMGELVADNLTMENSMRYIMMGGEKMKHFYDRSFIAINGYGPTESAVSCTSFYVDKEYKNIPIGKPWINTPCFVMDENLQEVPVGQDGELCLGGTQLAVGYKNNEEKTKAAFVKNPDKKSVWKRLYRTGDRVKMQGDGNLEYVGRIDNQVKISGYRIELGEIEGAIAKHNKIKETVVTVYDSGTAQYIAAYYTVLSHVSEQELKVFLTPLLPEYMVPSFFVQLEKMPITLGGKVDKKALPLPLMENRQYIPPTNENEKMLCEIFAKTLGVEKVGIRDDFFEMGGTSLAVSKIVIQCANRKLPIVYGDIFKLPTVEKLAQKLEPQQTEKGDVQSAKTPKKEQEQKKWTVLSHNNMNDVNDIGHLPLGNVLVSGVTGFLGIHVLRELFDSDADKIYCFVRKNKSENAKKRLMSMLFYYFENTYEELFDSRIEIVEADITQDDLNELIKNIDVDCVINCAACVKHFAVDDILEKVNVHGVENLIQVALKKNAKLIQISTVSVAGENVDGKFPAELELTEELAEFGQAVSNKYIESKLKAELAVLRAVEKGMKGKIIRVGNLMGRYSDGEFQINFSTNGFMRTIKAYACLGKFPMSAMNELIDFSPVDSTAKAIVALAATQETFTVFHAFNNHKIEMGDFIYGLNQYGIKIDAVSDSEFEWAVEQGMKDPERSLHISGLLMYRQEDKESVKKINASNRFTTSALYRLHVKWPLISDEYLEKVIAALNTLGYF